MIFVWDDSWNWNDEFSMGSTWDMKGLVSMWHGIDIRWSSVSMVREWWVGVDFARNTKEVNYE